MRRFGFDQQSDAFRRPFPVQIVSGLRDASGGLHQYYYIEQVRDPAGGHYSGLPGGRSGGVNPCPAFVYELNNQDLMEKVPFYAEVHYDGMMSGAPLFVFNFGWQTQATVQVLASGNPYSGRVVDIVDNGDGTITESFRNYCWINDRNGDLLRTGDNYGGQLVSTSGRLSGVMPPIYMVNADVPPPYTSGITTTITGPVVTDVSCQSGTLSVTVETLFLQFMSGLLVSGYLGP